MSWIHIEDIVGMALLALDHPEANGPINGTAPHPVRNAEFSRALSRALWRPYAPWRVFLPIGPPDFVLRLVLGEVARVVTTGQRVLPTRAEAPRIHLPLPGAGPGPGRHLSQFAAVGSVEVAAVEGSHGLNVLGCPSQDDR